ncbi:MAG: PHB depolymerase family esterase [Bacteroidota bacterium]
MNPKFLIIALLLVFSACRKEKGIENVLPMQVFVIQGVNYLTLVWDPVSGIPDSSLEFSVFLNDSLVVSHLKARAFTFAKLKENSLYHCLIETYEGNAKVAEQIVLATTLKNKPPGDFSVYEMAIRNNSVELKWNKSNDPENEAVVYDILLNGQVKASGISNPAAQLTGLLAGAYYSGEIIARDTAGNSTKSAFIFRTITVANSILINRTANYQGYKRNFSWYVPANYDTSVSVPLVFSLHGANGNAWNEIQGSYFKTVADRENFLLLMPQALLGSFNGETIFQWNAHYIFPWDDVAFLSYLIDYMFTRYHVDLSKVYISGMSNGGFMTFFAARGLQYRLAAVAPISGLISSNVYENYTLSRPVPLCYMHGTADNIVRINSNPSADEILRFWAENNHCIGPPVVSQLPDISTYDNSTVTLYQYNGYLPDSEIQFYKINGGGHSVPGVEPGANMDINAYEVIWSFFRRHSYPGHSPGTTVILN